MKKPGIVKKYTKSYLARSLSLPVQGSFENTSNSSDKPDEAD